MKGMCISKVFDTVVPLESVRGTLTSYFLGGLHKVYAKFWA